MAVAVGRRLVGAWGPATAGARLDRCPFLVAVGRLGLLARRESFKFSRVHKCRRRQRLMPLDRGRIRREQERLLVEVERGSACIGLLLRRALPLRVGLRLGGRKVTTNFKIRSLTFPDVLKLSIL